MRLAIAAFVLLGLVATAHAGDALAPYAGRIVISPEAPPSVEYDLIKGPPWPMHLVGVIPRAVTKPLTLVVIDKADPKQPLLTFEVTSKKRIVIAHSEATIAAGFAVGKTYVVRLMLGKTVLAKATLALRD